MSIADVVLGVKFNYWSMRVTIFGIFCWAIFKKKWFENVLSILQMVWHYYNELCTQTFQNPEIHLKQKPNNMNAVRWKQNQIW
jgi:hypothetical protein